MGIRDNIRAALGRKISDSPDVALERVRQAMLQLVDDIGGCDRLDKKIMVAKDVAELWFIRPELMYFVSAARGEEVARERLEKITALFKSHHMGGARSRFAAF